MKALAVVWLLVGVSAAGFIPTAAAAPPTIGGFEILMNGAAITPSFLVTAWNSTTSSLNQVSVRVTVSNFDSAPLGACGVGGSWTRRVDVDSFNWTGSVSDRYKLLTAPTGGSNGVWELSATNVVMHSTSATFDANNVPTAAGGVDGTMKVRARAYWYCAANAAIQDSASQIVDFKVDNLAPTITAGTVSMASPPGAKAGSAIVGSTVTLPWSGTDSDPATATLVVPDLFTLKALTSSAGANNLTQPGAGSATTLTVGDATVAHDATLAVVARLTDDVGNWHETTWSFKLDNRRPDHPNSNSFGSAKVHLSNLKIPSTINANNPLASDGKLRAEFAWTQGEGALSLDDDVGAVVVDVSNSTEMARRSGAVSAPATTADLSYFIYNFSDVRQWRLRLLDDDGNVQNASSPRTLLLKDYPRVSLACIVCGTDESRAWTDTSRFLWAPAKVGTINGTVTDPDNDLGGAPTSVKMYMRRADNGQWFQNTGNDQFASTPKFFPLAQGLSNSQNGVEFSFSNFSARTFAAGNYILGIVAQDAAGNRYNYTVPLKVDGVAPVVTTPSIATKGEHSTDNNPLKVNFTISPFTGTGGAWARFDSGVKSATVRLVDSNGKVPVSTTTGARAERVIANGTGPFTDTTATTTTTSKLVSKGWEKGGAWVNTSFPNLPVGNYTATILVEDEAGNIGKREFTAVANNEIYKVRPRARIDTNANVPWKHVGGIEASVLAAHEVVGGANCASATLCPVTQVEIWGRNAGETADQLLITLFSSDSTKQVDGFWYYNYSRSGGALIPFGSLDTDAPIDIRAKAIVARGGEKYVTITDWVRVKTSEQSALQIQYPDNDWLLNVTGSLRLKARFETSLHWSAVQTNYTIRDLSTGAVVAQNADWAPSPATPSAIFNYSSALLTLPPGEYEIKVTTQNKNTSTVLDSRTRYFAVLGEPSVHILDASEQTDPRVAKDPSADSYRVRDSFHFGFWVDHNFANVTSDSHFKFRLQRAEVIAGQQQFYDVGQDGFSVQVRNHSFYRTDVDKTFVNVTISLPASAGHNEPFILNVTAETDAQGIPGVTYADYAAKATVVIRLDEKGPLFTLDDHVTRGVNATGIDAAGGPDFHLGVLPVLFGLADDDGSGTEKVEVHVTRPGTGETWDERVGKFVTNPDAAFWWNATVGNRTGSDKTWWVYGSAALQNELKKQPFVRYVVDVRGVDATGISAGPASFNFSFDVDPPTVSSFVVRLTDGTLVKSSTTDSPPNGIQFVSYLGRKVGLKATGDVADEICVKRVSLVFVAPSGTVRRAPILERDECVTTANDAWSFDTTDGNTTFPSGFLTESGSTDDAGIHKVYVEVEDAAGHVTASAVRYWFRVRDDAAAEIGTLRFNPGTAGAGGGSRLLINVSEDYGVDRVEVEIYRDRFDGTYDPTSPVAKGVASRFRDVAANGTGLWIFNTTEVENFTLEIGSYTAHVRVLDSLGNSPGCVFGNTFRTSRSCKVSFLAVEEAGDLALDILKPEPGASYVGATLNLTAVVYSTTIAQSGITVRVGENASTLQDVTPQLSAIPGAGVTAGYNIYYNATVDPEWETLVAEVTATDIALVSTTERLELSVDSVAPNVTAEFRPRHVGEANATFVGPLSTLTFNATDAGSGVDRRLCRVDAGAERDCSTFRFADDTVSGAYVVNYTAVDRAGNRAAEKSLTVIYDSLSPIVTVTKEDADFVVTVEDAGVGVNESRVTVYYSTEVGAPTAFTAVPMTRVSGGTYQATLLNDTGVIHYYVEAFDLVGNKGGKHSRDNPGRVGEGGENRPPALTITSPAADATVRSPVAVQWTVTDPDGDVVTIGLSYEREDGSGGVIATNLAATTGSFSWDTSALPVGTYTLVVRASDAAAATEKSVTVTLQPQEPFRVVKPPTTRIIPGQSIAFEVNVAPTKPVAAVKAEYLIDGDAVGPARVLQKSAAGTYADSFLPEREGQYLVRVIVEYEDGSQPDVYPVGGFVVQGLKDDVKEIVLWSMQFVSLIALALATIGLAAYAAFVRWKP